MTNKQNIAKNVTMTSGDEENNYQTEASYIKQIIPILANNEWNVLQLKKNQLSQDSTATDTVVVLLLSSLAVLFLNSPVKELLILVYFVQCYR